MGRKSDLRIALNNVSFVGPGARHVVLLHNALHYSSESELAALGFRATRSLRAQAPVVRAASRRADVIVVPCSAMADRVARHTPQVAGRLVVRHHPVSAPSAKARPKAIPRIVLVPVLPAPYKLLGAHVNRLRVAASQLDCPEGFRIRITADRTELPDIPEDDRVEYIGRLPAQQLDRSWDEATAVYFPTGLEAFGYPLAEARVRGTWVIAQDTPQNAEIAGAALAGFDPGNAESLARALATAIGDAPNPDLDTFDPDAYFAWLLAGAQ